MRFSQTFFKTLKNAPKDEAATSARLLIRAGFIHKELAGVYDLLPLGLKTVEKIENVIREELNAIGGEELLLSTLQNPAPWQKTDRWNSNMDIWFKTELAAGGELGLAPTHEEPLTNLMHAFIKSYKDLPLYPYQFQTKFRNELRAKSGIMRTREFIMKDLYSFSPDRASHDAFYHSVETAYAKIFQQLGLGDCTFKTFASGGIFAKYSHEYQTLLDIGEDTIWHNANFSVCINDEVLNDEVLADLKIDRRDLTSCRAAEVGNIFTLGYKFSAPLQLEFTDQTGVAQPVFMGSYGIGITRLLGVIAEKFADTKGLIWPTAIAPFPYYLIAIGDRAKTAAEQLYSATPSLFFFDDRNLRPGEKFADADLIGLPYRLVISDKTLAQNSLEITARATEKTVLLPLSTLTPQKLRQPDALIS